MSDVNFNFNSDPFESLLRRFDGVAKGLSKYVRNRKTNDEIEKNRFANVKEIFDQMNVQLTEEERVALAIFAAQKQQGYENLKEVLRCSKINDASRVSDIGDEWFSAFTESSKEAFSRWSRVLHSQLLSRELENPGTVSVATLLKVMQLGEKDFNAFCGIFSTSYFHKNQVINPMVLSLDDKYLKKLGLSKNHLLLLEELGLVKISERPILKNLENFIGTGKTKYLRIIEYTTEHKITNFTYEVSLAKDPIKFQGVVVPRGKNNPFGNRQMAFFGYVQFTQIGRELANTLDSASVDEETVRTYLAKGMNIFRSEQQQELSKSIKKKKSSKKK